MQLRCSAGKSRRQRHCVAFSLECRTQVYALYTYCCCPTRLFLEFSVLKRLERPRVRAFSFVVFSGAAAYCRPVTFTRRLFNCLSFKTFRWRPSDGDVCSNNGDDDKLFLLFAFIKSQKDVVFTEPTINDIISTSSVSSVRNKTHLVNLQSRALVATISFCILKVQASHEKTTLKNYFLIS